MASVGSSTVAMIRVFSMVIVRRDATECSKPGRAAGLHAS